MRLTPDRQDRYLFFDYRHVLCGDLEWRDAAGAAVPVVGPAEPPVPVTADASWLARGVRLVAQPAEKLAPLPAGAPRGSRVLYDGGVYRSWSIKAVYPPGKDLGSYSQARAESVRIIYAESRDGYDWAVKAESPITPHGVSGFDGFTVFVDPNGPAHERYKALFMATTPPEEHAALLARYQEWHPRYHDWRILWRQKPTCFFGAVSPDGLQWEAISEPLMIHYGDTDNSVYYDAWLKKYVLFTRLYPFDRRVIARAETVDFRHWGPVQPIIWPGLENPHLDIYTNGYSHYPGQPDYHLMFPMVYNRETQESDVALYSSADGITWQGVPGGPVLRHGRPEDWDGAFIHAGKDLVPFGAGRVAIPYGGTMYPHKYPRWPHVLQASRGGWACWPEGRMTALTAEGTGGFPTVALLPTGRTLRLDLRVARAGEVRVGIENVPGRSLADCDPCGGDGLVTVHWRGHSDIGVPEGEPVYLRVAMRHAELFSLGWA